MRFLVQRVIGASVDIDGARFSGFEGPGLLVLCGIAPDDTPAKADKLCAKLLKLRIFEDDRGAMNRSVLDVDGLRQPPGLLHRRPPRGRRAAL